VVNNGTKMKAGKGQFDEVLRRMLESLLQKTSDIKRKSETPQPQSRTTIRLAQDSRDGSFSG
jgi:hypothetical protein